MFDRKFGKRTSDMPDAYCLFLDQLQKCDEVLEVVYERKTPPPEARSNYIRGELHVIGQPQRPTSLYVYETATLT